MPILGIIFDANDVGIIGGLTLATLMYILASCLKREAINLDIATKRAVNKNKDNLVLLLMAQVLAPIGMPDTERPERVSSLGAKITLYTIYVFPAVLHGCICLNDISTNDVRNVLEPAAWMRCLDWTLEAGCWVLIVVLTAVCFRAQRNTDLAFDSLQDAVAANFRRVRARNEQRLLASSGPKQDQAER